MGLADTAKLLASLDLQDAMSPKLKGAIGNVAAAEGRIGALSSKASAFAANLRGGVSNALTTFGGRLRSLASAGLGLLGIGGIFGIGALFKSALGEARSFGDEVIRLSRVMGLNVETTSALASAFHHFGIDADAALKVGGMLEKNLGLITSKRKTEISFMAQFHLGLRAGTIGLTDYSKALATLNSKQATHIQKTAAQTVIQRYFKQGIVDGNEELLRLADYWNNKGIPQSVKVLALTKLLGRSWQDLLPFLNAGRKGITAAEEEAKRLGLTLTKDNIDALKKSKDATRDWDTALGGLKLQLGVRLLPTLTNFVKTATEFVVNHREDILNFFSKAADFVGTFADALTRIPSGLGITDVLKGAIRVWDQMPDGLRDLLVKGIAADRSIKFLFGVSPIKLALGSLLGGIGKGLFQRGTTPANPLFVADVAGGLGKGLPPVGGLPGAGASVFSRLMRLALGALVVLDVAMIADAIKPAITDIGMQIHNAIAPKGSAFDDLGAQWREWRANAPWPFGQKDVPSWVPRIGPTPSAPAPTSLGASGTGGLSPDDRQDLNNLFKTSLVISDRTEAVRIGIASAASLLAAKTDLDGRIVQHSNEITAARTEALRTTLSPKLSTANDRLQRIAEKKYEMKVAIHPQPITIVNRISASSLLTASYAKASYSIAGTNDTTSRPI